jgi:hypothetical protein
VHTFWNFKWLCIMVYDEPWITLVQLLHCLLLSSCQLSTLQPAAQLLLSQSQEGYLVRHHLWLSNVLERLSWASCELLCVTNPSHHKQKAFLYEYPLHWVLLLTKKKRTCLLPRLSWSWTLLLPGDKIRNLLCPLKLFYFYLWPICWLSHIVWLPQLFPLPLNNAVTNASSIEFGALESTQTGRLGD